MPAAQQVARLSSLRQRHVDHGIRLHGLNFAAMDFESPGKNHFSLAHPRTDDLQAVSRPDTVAPLHQPEFCRRCPDNPDEIAITTVQAVFGVHEGAIIIKQRVLFCGGY